MTTISPSEPAACDKRYHHGDLRRALLSAADAVLERSGPSALSLRAVAREAGVSPAAPYHHFKDKDDLIAAVASEGFAQLHDAIENAWRDAPEDAPKRSTLGLAYLKFAQGHPALYRIMYDSARKGETIPDRSSEGSTFLTRKRALQFSDGSPMDETEMQLIIVADWCLAHGLAEMRNFTQFETLKEKLGGEEAFLRAVLDRADPNRVRSGSKA